MIDNMNIFIKGKLKRFPKKAIPSLENPYVRETFNIGSVQLIVYDDDPYYSVYFIFNKKVIAIEYGIVDIHQYIRDIHKFSDKDIKRIIIFQVVE